MTLMKIENMISNSRADCSGCSACANICPKNCIVMQRDDEGFSYPKINHEICIQCGRCEKVCPALNFKSATIDKLPEVFVAIYPDAKIRRHSSSGGAFTALSEIILKNGGIIFGAGFNEDWRVVHMSAENLDELENLRGSKYVQSQIGDVYKRVKVELENNRKVLFSGTPCQCAGLKSFLGKDYSNLLTVDIICHGTPSPLLLENYLEYITKGHDIAHVNFRSKRFGWTNNHVEVNFFDCGYYAKSNRQDLYLYHFLHGLIERPSCHECKFKFPNSKSDLTIGDAWGVQNFAPKFFDNRGTSLVVVHTAKGKNFLSKAELVTRQVPFDVLPTNNPCFLTSSIPDDRRQNFFDDVKIYSDVPVAVMQKYFQQSPQKVNTSGRNAKLEAKQKFDTILRHIAKLRDKNFLFITSTIDEKIIRTLEKKFLSNFKDSGGYILQIPKDGNLIFVDCLHSLIKLNAKASFENLHGILKEFHITNIFVDKRINFSAATKNFLTNCNVPIQDFELEIDRRNA